MISLKIWVAASNGDTDNLAQEICHGERNLKIFFGKHGFEPAKYSEINN